MSITLEEAPQGLVFDPAEENLVNLEPVEEFDARVKDDIDGLLWLGFLTDEFTLYGHRFVIRTLTRGERLAVTLAIKEYEDSLGAVMALETATVAASVLMRDGAPLYPQLSSDEHPLIRIKSAFEEVSKWYDPLIEALYRKYSALMTRQVQAFFELEGK